MCTVTFIPKRDGYQLAMNRDERRTRVAGLPPIVKELNGRKIVLPMEPEGGTWIALNDCAASLALINWYSVLTRPAGRSVSRGEIVKAACPAQTSAEVDAALQELPLARINPFRLIGVFPTQLEIVEWSWNLARLERVVQPWQTGQWISSGFDEPGAQRVRSETCRQAMAQKSFGTIDWLRRLHRSHTPAPGPFATCMHRADAVTVSYTEIVVKGARGQMQYHAGSPCERPPVFRQDVNIKR